MSDHSLDCSALGLPRTQTSLSPAQRKAGRRQRASLPSVLFPWSLAAHHQSLASTLRKTKRLRRRLALGCFADTRGQQALAQHGHPLYIQQGETPA